MSLLSSAHIRHLPEEVRILDIHRIGPEAPIHTPVPEAVVLEEIRVERGVRERAEIGLVDRRHGRHRDTGPAIGGRRRRLLGGVPFPEEPNEFRCGRDVASWRFGGLRLLP